LLLVLVPRRAPPLLLPLLTVLRVCCMRCRDAAEEEDDGIEVVTNIFA